MFEKSLTDKTGKKCPDSNDMLVWAKSFAVSAGLTLDDKTIGLLSAWFSASYNKGHAWGMTKGRAWERIRQSNHDS